MSKRKNSRSIACEPLEDRRMFVTYQVTGTSAADAISISIDEANNKIISAVNGVSDSASDLVNNNIQIDGLGGNDTITIVETGNNTVVVNAGNGFDTINIALGANDLDAIDDNITVNGDGDTDTVNLCDNGNTTSVTFALSGGNVIGRTSMPSMTVNAEIVEIRGGSLADTFSVSDAPSFLATRLLGNSGSDVANLVGAAGETARFQPNPGVVNGGSVFFPVADSAFTFASIESMQAQNFDDFVLQTGNANDMIAVNSNTVTGSSGGVAFSTVGFTNLGSLTLDVGFNDAGASTDTLTFSGTGSQADVINVNAETGTNTLTNTGTFTVDTGLGANNGNNLKVVDNGGALTFHGIQTLKRLEVNNGGVIRFDGGVDTRISVQELAVVSGTGTFDMAVNQNASVPTGSSFAIGNGCTFVKKGQGSMSINGTQSHATNSVLKVENGTLNVGSDAGTASAHPLTLWAAGGVMNLGSTQHVKNVRADTGFLSMSSNGSRVLVTEDASTGSEGGVINLNNNDMMVVNPPASIAANITAMLHQGYADGGWDGLGINSQTAASSSNTAIGMLTGNDYFNNNGSTTFDGEVVHGNDLLLKYTYYGDVDFNGSVDASDYNLIDFGFTNHLSGWAFGDADGNGSVDASDYNVIDFAFSTQTAVL